MVCANEQVQLDCIKKSAFLRKRLHQSDPAGIRTQGPYIKSVLLYQLSYGISFLRVQIYPKFLVYTTLILVFLIV